MTEDIPTGLVVFEALAQMLDIDCTVCTRIIEMYNQRFGTDARKNGRNLKDFSKEFIIDYLLGIY